MKHPFRRAAVILGALLAAVYLTAMPALADEDMDIMPRTSDEGGVIVWPSPAVPPPPTPTPSPTPSPTPAPTPEPTPSPTPEPPPDEGGGDDGAGGGGGGGNYYGPGAYTPGNTTASTPTPTPTPETAPSEEPTPLPASQVTAAPSPSPSSGPENTPEETHRYVTFAKVSRQIDTTAMFLFYGGILLALLGTGGLVALLMLSIRDRRRAERDKILHEIEEAEHRQAPRRPTSTPVLFTTPDERPSRPRREDPYGPLPPVSGESQPAPRPHMRPDTPLIPQSASMYTDEFPVVSEDDAPVVILRSSDVAEGQEVRHRVPRRQPPEIARREDEAPQAPEAAPAPEAPKESAPPQPAPQKPAEKPAPDERPQKPSRKKNRKRDKKKAEAPAPPPPPETVEEPTREAKTIVIDRIEPEEFEEPEQLTLEVDMTPVKLKKTKPLALDVGQVRLTDKSKAVLAALENEQLPGQMSFTDVEAEAKAEAENAADEGESSQPDSGTEPPAETSGEKE